tara:strand:- start:197 stop:2035 length:1839 start_codon:yes stop_codon:yes gene_type:complete
MEKFFKYIFSKDLFFSDVNYKLKRDFKKLNIIKVLFDLWKKINKRRQNQFYLLIFLMIISGFAEFLSLTSIIPFLKVITDINSLDKNSLFSNLYNAFGLTNNNQLVLLTTLIFLITIYCSAICRLTNLLFNFRFTAGIGSELSTESYRRALYQPYKKHLKWNSSVIINTLTKDINTTVNGLLQLLLFINSTIISISIFIGLFIVNWKIALLLITIFCLSYFLIANSNKIQLEKNSYIITLKAQERIQALQEGLGAMKEILIGGNQKYYEEIYRNTDYPIRKVNSRNKFLGIFPKFLLETLGITIIALIGAIISNNGVSSEAISLIGFIALASHKLLPALQTIYSSWLSLKGSTASIINVINLLDLKEHKPNIALKINYFKDFIELKNVSFRYEEDKPFVLNDVSLKIKFGEKIGIIGRTGSGKSTLIDLLMTLIEPSKGKLLIDNKNIYNKNSKFKKYYWRNQIAHVPQLIFLSDGTFYENIALGEEPKKINIEKVKQAAKKAKLSKFIESFPNGYNTVIGERGIRLSGGQRQRISIARAFYRDRKFFIFDEATSALDTETEKSVIDSIFNQGSETTLILITHRLSTLKECDRILQFENGSIINDGSPKDFL